MIVGLGNPGPKYAQTRHNIGFMALERLARRHRITLGSEKFKARVETGFVDRQKVVLVQPIDFMNRSGGPVSKAANYYEVSPDEIIVMHDDVDLEPGQLKLKAGGGHGGHNGLRDIAQKLGSRDFLRVRLGVGRPEHGDVRSHVLGKFQSDEQALVDDLVEEACDAVEMILDEGISAAQNRFH